VARKNGGFPARYIVFWEENFRTKTIFRQAKHRGGTIAPSLPTRHDATGCISESVLKIGQYLTLGRAPIFTAGRAGGASIDSLDVVYTHEMSDEPGSDHDTLDGRFRLLVRHVGDVHPVERSLTHSDAVLATAGPAAVLARQQETTLHSFNPSINQPA